MNRDDPKEATLEVRNALKAAMKLFMTISDDPPLDSDGEPSIRVALMASMFLVVTGARGARMTLEKLHEGMALAWAAIEERQPKGSASAWKDLH